MTEPLDTMVQRLLGCEWGRRIALPADMQPCGQRATRRVMLHGSSAEGDFMVQLCDPHGDVVLSLTDPHGAEVTR